MLGRYPPRLDLANEDLVRSHVHAIWLAETNLSLGRSLKDLLDLGGDPPSLELLPNVRGDISRPATLDPCACPRCPGAPESAG